MSEELLQSQFKHLEKAAELQETQLDKTEFDRRMGEDVTLQHMDTAMADAKSIFAERFSEEAIPKDFLEVKIEEAYQVKISHGKMLSGMSRGKRAKSAEKKINLQKHLLKEQNLLRAKRTEDREFAQKYLKQGDLEMMGQLYTTEEEQEAVREWMVMSKKRGDTEVEMVRDGLMSEQWMIANITDVMKEVDKLPIEQFAYTNDKEFVSAFAQKYDLIRKHASAGALLDRFLREGDGISEGLPIARIKAKIQLMNDLKGEYEDRMKLMSSPYYALLTEKDLDKFKKPEDIPQDDAAFAEFVSLYQKVNGTKSKDIASRFKTILKQTEEERKDQDVARLDTIFEGIEIDESITDEAQKKAQLQRVYNDLTRREKAKFPTDNLAFMKDVEATMGGALIDGIDEKALDVIEKRLASIFETGKSFDQDLAPEFFENFKQSFQNLCELRRNYHTAEKVGNFLKSYDNNMGTDAFNEAFQKTPEYKKLMAITSADGVPSELMGKAGELKAQYLEAVTDMLITFKKSGYMIDATREARIGQDPEGAIEAERNRNRNSSKNPNWEFPTIWINDVEYKDYGFSKLFRKGGELTFPEEVIPLIEQIDQIQTQQAEVKSLFDGEGGEKAMINRVYAKIAKEKIEILEAQIEAQIYISSTMKANITSVTSKNPDLGTHIGGEAEKERFRKAMADVKDECDTTYTSKKDTDPVAATSESKVKIGIRSSGSEQAKADMAMRGDLFESMYTDSVELCRTVTQDAPMDVLLKGRKITMLPGSAAQVTEGGGNEEAVTALIDMLDKRIMNDWGIEYFSNAADTYGDFAVFEGSLKSFVAFQLQAVITNLMVGSSRLYAGQQDVGAESKEFAKRAFQTLQAMPSVYEFNTKPQIAEMLQNNPKLVALRTRYEKLINDITAKITEKKTPQ